MKKQASSRSTPLLIAVGIAYAAVGFVTGELAHSAESPQWRNLWRLSAWPLSLVVFAVHFLYERARAADPVVHRAVRVGVAAGLGGLFLALVGPVRSHWGAPDFGRAAVLSLVLWPLLTGIPAFLLAWFAGNLLAKLRPGPAVPLA